MVAEEFARAGDGDRAETEGGVAMEGPVAQVIQDRAIAMVIAGVDGADQDVPVGVNYKARSETLAVEVKGVLLNYLPSSAGNGKISSRAWGGSPGG